MANTGDSCCLKCHGKLYAGLASDEVHMLYHARPKVAFGKGCTSWVIFVGDEIPYTLAVRN